MLYLFFVEQKVVQMLGLCMLPNTILLGYKICRATVAYFGTFILLCLGHLPHLIVTYEASVIPWHNISSSLPVILTCK